MTDNAKNMNKAFSLFFLHMSYLSSSRVDEDKSSEDTSVNHTIAVHNDVPGLYEFVSEEDHSVADLPSPCHLPCTVHTLQPVIKDTTASDQCREGVQGMLCCCWLLPQISALGM